MDVPGSHETDAPATPRSGLDRRTLLKRAAAAGAVAWTAPIIIDSLASPAAATTCNVPFAAAVGTLATTAPGRRPRCR